MDEFLKDIGFSRVDINKLELQMINKQLYNEKVDMFDYMSVQVKKAGFEGKYEHDTYLNY